MESKKSMQAKRDAISKMTLMTDIFFEAFAEDVNAIQEMLRVILKDELTVLNVIPQKQIRNLFGRSVRLDAVCKLSDDRIVEIEIQNEDNDDHVKRAFFNSAQIMVKNSQTGTKFEELPHVIVIYISGFDPFGNGLLIYHPQLVIKETEEVIDDGTEYIFVNTKADDGTKLARLMKRMQEREIADPEFPEITRKFNQLKNNEKGVNHMCQLMEEYTKDARAEGKAEGKAEGLLLGKIEIYYNDLKLTPTEIAKKLEITEDKVKELIASL